MSVTQSLDKLDGLSRNRDALEAEQRAIASIGRGRQIE